MLEGADVKAKIVACDCKMLATNQGQTLEDGGGITMILINLQLLAIPLLKLLMLA